MYFNAPLYKQTVLNEYYYGSSVVKPIEEFFKDFKESKVVQTYTTFPMPILKLDHFDRHFWLF